MRDLHHHSGLAGALLINVRLMGIMMLSGVVGHQQICLHWRYPTALWLS